jgi:hypothetical protein
VVAVPKTINRDDLLNKANLLRGEADKLEDQYHTERPMPETWEVGMRVKYLYDKDWCWRKDQEGTIKSFAPDNKKIISAHDYQVFFTVPDGSTGSFWTNPSDVELVLV